MEVEHLLSMHVILDSILSITKEKSEASINSRKGRKENELQQKEFLFLSFRIAVVTSPE